MPSYPELSGRVIAITGAAQGIGAETARAFGEQHARVALLDIDEKGAHPVAERVTASGGQSLVIRTDVTHEKSVTDAITRTVAEFGGLDVLICCAGGYGRLATVEELTPDEWYQTVTLNLHSVYLCCRAAIPHLKQSKAGRIINVASISGRTVQGTSSPAYGAAKAGVIQLTRFLAHQLGPAGVTANSVAPVTTLTPRVAALRTEADIERIAAQIPMRRLATPLDHAQAMLYLASDGAAFVNGIVLDVNGGRVMM